MQKSGKKRNIIKESSLNSSKGSFQRANEPVKPSYFSKAIPEENKIADVSEDNKESSKNLSSFNFVQDVKKLSLDDIMEEEKCKNESINNRLLSINNSIRQAEERVSNISQNMANQGYVPKESSKSSIGSEDGDFEEIDMDESAQDIKQVKNIRPQDNVQVMKNMKNQEV